MSGCKLVIGDRTVLESNDGPPEAEFSLFDSGDIELQATEPGTIREVGYRTNAAYAKKRLDAYGVTVALAESAAKAMTPKLAEAYARGAAVKSVARWLGACELFDGRAYDGKLRRYQGGWLDLQALAIDMKMLRAASALQALYLVALLDEVPDATPIYLSTLDYSRTRRPGERSYRRVPLEHAEDVPDVLEGIADSPRASMADRAPGPLRTALLEEVSARAATCVQPQTRERLAELVVALSVREPPSRGPLADGELWALETQLEKGDAAGVAQKLDALERARGRTPSTLYLRARASLSTGAEPPAVIAERVSALSQSMSSFFELALLAARAWTAAGDARRGKAFARDLSENPSAPAELRQQALELLEGPAKSKSAAVIPATTTPRTESANAMTAASLARPSQAQLGAVTANAASGGFADTDDAPDTAIDPVAIVAVSTAARSVEDLTVRDLGAPPLSSGGMVAAAPSASRTSAPPIQASRIVSVGQPAGMPSAVEDIVTARVVDVDPVPATSQARRASDWTQAATVPVGEGSAPPDVTAAPARRASGAAFATVPTLMSEGTVRGASQPPFQTERPPSPGGWNGPSDPTQGRFQSQAPPVRIPRATPPPRDVHPGSEAADSLSLPPGLHGQPPAQTSLPRTAIEARVAFTWLSRELGRDYRAKHKVELRTDMASIEAMQRFLRERFPTGHVATPDDALDLRRHAAFLSEILARNLGAQWVDIGPSELGYWAMLVPPSTRVWPFGRVARFVLMGHKERDLVSYYLEIEARARR